MSIQSDWRLASARDARLQHQCLRWEQLLRAGLTASKIHTRTRRGELVRVHPRVYALGDPEPIPLCRESAALLSLGPGSVLAGRSAAFVWGLASQRQRPVEVMALGNPRPREGVQIHRVNSLPLTDIEPRCNLRVTSPARTVVDMAARASIGEVERVIAEGMANHLLSERRLKQLIGRLPCNHPGAATVRRLFERDNGPVLTRSDGEREFRALLRAAHLPQPVSNARMYGFELDLYWPDCGLVVELDGFPFHSSRSSFERDRKKDQVLTARGLLPLRITGRQLHEEPFAVVATIAQVVATRRAGGMLAGSGDT